MTATLDRAQPLCGGGQTKSTQNNEEPIFNGLLRPCDHSNMTRDAKTVTTGSVKQQPYTIRS